MNIKTDGGADAETIERAIADWLKAYLSKLLDLQTDEIDEDTSFDRYGLDSLATVGMASDLEQWLGSEVDPAAAEDYTDIGSLARALAADENLQMRWTARSNG